MNFELKFPTLLHEQTAESAYQFFHDQPSVDSVVVVNSCARGQAIPESDLDMNVLVSPGLSNADFSRLEASWRQELAGNRVLQSFLMSGVHAHIHLDIVRGEFVPEIWDDGGGPDGFEMGIGNLLAYGSPLHGAGPYYRQLQKQWLPYYNEELRCQRLETARASCQYDLDHVPFFVKRELYFQAFDRLYKSFHEFLQALFIAHRVYPLAYNKWIRMQVVEWLGLPDLYRLLPQVISVGDIESSEVVDKAKDLRDLLEGWVNND